jgi:hypothetical protein
MEQTTEYKDKLTSRQDDYIEHVKTCDLCQGLPAKGCAKAMLLLDLADEAHVEYLVSVIIGEGVR